MWLRWDDMEGRLRFGVIVSEKDGRGFGGGCWGLRGWDVVLEWEVGDYWIAASWVMPLASKGFLQGQGPKKALLTCHDRGGNYRCL